jgi:hypothetical protein
MQTINKVIFAFVICYMVVVSLVVSNVLVKLIAIGIFVERNVHTFHNHPLHNPIIAVHHLLEPFCC